MTGQKGLQFLDGQSLGERYLARPHPEAEQVHPFLDAGDLHNGLTPVELDLFPPARGQGYIDFSPVVPETAHEPSDHRFRAGEPVLLNQPVIHTFRYVPPLRRGLINAMSAILSNSSSCSTPVYSQKPAHSNGFSGWSTFRLASAPKWSAFTLAITCENLLASDLCAFCC